MNRDETIELFERCEAARREAKQAALAEGKSEGDIKAIAHEAAKAIWNGEWAEPLLAERKAMEDGGRWETKINTLGKLSAHNEETRGWFRRAKIDFSGCCFLKDDQSAKKITEEEIHDKLTFSKFSKTEISLQDGNADFSGFIFPADTSFSSAQFKVDAWFGRSFFNGIAWFDRSHFGGLSWFNHSSFSSEAWFDHAHFGSLARFEEAHFNALARFEHAYFKSDVWFARTNFQSVAWFNRSHLSGLADFNKTHFRNDATFERAVFDCLANFILARFDGRARFDSARFGERASFGQACFSDTVRFDKVKFRCRARFDSTNFGQIASFCGTHFRGAANFNAIRGERAFSLAEATFEAVPDFIQAHFEEAPRLDNVTVVGRMVDAYPELQKRKDDEGNEVEPTRWQQRKHALKSLASYPWRLPRGAWRRYRRGLEGHPDVKDIPARWRALKRLAVQAHDQDREHEFFARELRSNRFLDDWPWPWPFWKLEGLFSFGRFWAGVAYGLLSNYGRSALLPVFWWGIGVAIGAVLYFGAHQELIAERARVRPWGEEQMAVAPVSLWDAWWAENNHACYVSKAQATEERFGARELTRTPKIEIIGLSADLRAQSSAPREALQLALRDGFLILYGDADTAHRVYGCLYGVELYGGGTPVAIVPPQVANFSALHKLWSAVMIFLFGLALRNMLKMK